MRGYTTTNSRRTDIPGETAASVVLALTRSLTTPQLVTVEAAIRAELDRRINTEARAGLFLARVHP